MGKDEYDKSQGGFLPPVSPEPTGESRSVSQGTAVNHISCDPPSDCQISKRFISRVKRPKENPRDKRSSSDGSYYQTELLKSNSSDLNFQTPDDTSETSLYSDLAPITPNYDSDPEELGLSTHRPKANRYLDLATNATTPVFRRGLQQGRNERAAGDNSTCWNGNGSLRSDKRYPPIKSSSPPLRHNFVHVQGDYALDDVSVTYHPQQLPHPRSLRNYEQYVVPPNFTYTADDIYRNAFSVGSHPNLMAPKKMVPDMFSFVNALVSPPFFAHHSYQHQPQAPCQYYTAVNQRQSAQQAARGGESYATNNTVQPQCPMGRHGYSPSPSSPSSSYADRLHHQQHPSNGSGYSDHGHQSTNTSSKVAGQENWLQNGIGGGEEVPSTSLGSGASYTNGKPIFRSRSFSAVEQSGTKQADLSTQQFESYLDPMSASTSSPHHSNYSFGDMENALHHLQFCHSNTDAPPYPNGSALPPSGNSNMHIGSENLHSSTSQQPESTEQSWAAQFTWSSCPEKPVVSQQELYEDDPGVIVDATENVFSHSSSSSFPGWSLSMSNQKSASYHDSQSRSFSKAENYLSFGVNKPESFSDTEIYSKSSRSTHVHNFQPNYEYEDVCNQDAQNITQAVFVMDEEIFNSSDPNFQPPVPPLNLASSSEFDDRQFGSSNDRDCQEPIHAPRIHEDGFSRLQGVRYNCTKGPKKTRGRSGVGATAEINHRSASSPNGYSGNNTDFRPTTNGAHVSRRHWEKSSTLWASSNCRDLNTFSSVGCQQQGGSQSSNHQRKEVKKNGPCGGGGQVKNSKKKNSNRKIPRPQPVPLSSRCLKSEGTTDLEKSTLWKEDNEVSCWESAESENVDAFESELTKWHNGDVYPWHHLPEEIWLNVFSFLGNHDRFQCSLVSKQFHRILQDESLWRHITLSKKMLQDAWLMRIAHLHPSSLELIQCYGDEVTAAGLTYLFKHCTNSLLKLRFSRCSRGQLTGDNILLASTVCRNLTHVDASWCTVTDSGLSAIAKSCDRLESLCLNGCGLIADNGLKTLATLHGKSLKELEMFGCFNITSRGIRHLASICQNLRTLQLGQCYRITDSCIAQVSSSLCCVENLDLRGCKQIKDTCIEKIVNHCSRLQTLALANCPNISNNAMQKIASTLPGIRSIDVCGCRLITDESINRLATNCRQLVYLDISSTGCTYKSVCRLAEQGSTDLETLKLNFITGITESNLKRLTNHCKRLTTLHLYGCKRVKNLERLQALHPKLIIESDKN